MTRVSIYGYDCPIMINVLAKLVFSPVVECFSLRLELRSEAAFPQFAVKCPPEAVPDCVRKANRTQDRHCDAMIGEKQHFEENAHL
jgi:hypothetical protein